MLLCPNPDMFPNRFTETELPTKAQIFDRTGQRAVAPNGAYSGDDAVKIGSSSTEKAEAFARAAESYERPEPVKTKDNE